jgi:hypothetical protein
MVYYLVDTAKEKLKKKKISITPVWAQFICLCKDVFLGIVKINKVKLWLTGYSGWKWATWDWNPLFIINHIFHERFHFITTWNVPCLCFILEDTKLWGGLIDNQTDKRIV